MKMRTVALALTLACGFAAIGEAKKKITTQTKLNAIKKKQKKHKVKKHKFHYNVKSGD
jgi:hypothetical protein